MFLLDVEDKYEEGTIEIPDSSEGNDLFLVYSAASENGYVSEKNETCLIQALMIILVEPQTMVIVT